MFAVTGSPREYIEETPEIENNLVFYLFEVMAAADDSGWELYWYNDGSDTGCILCRAWGPSGSVDGPFPTPIHMSEDDIWTPEEIEFLWEEEFSVEEHPDGVRYRLIAGEWNGPFDLEDMLSRGTVTKNKDTALMLKHFNNPNFETASDYL